jgi:hypothetical protein
MPGEQSRSQLTNERKLQMKLTTLVAAAALAAVAAPAVAHDYSGDFVCNITDNTGNRLVYTFANNTGNADGSFGGTYVETGFVKNGQPVVSPVGYRPIWFWAANGASGVIASKEAPGWRIVLDPAFSATLTHNGRPVGWGSCSRGGGAVAKIPNSAVGDMLND